MDTPQYYSFQGSPDVFDAKGQYVAGDQIKTLGLSAADGNLDTSKITPLNYVRPDVKTATDFSTYAGKPVDVAAFTKVNPAPTVTGTPEPTDYKSILAGATASIPDTTAENTKYNNTYETIISRMKDLEGMSADAKAAEDAAGVSVHKKNISDLTSQLRSLNAEASASNVQSEGRQTTMGQVIGEQGQIERVRSIKALALSSQIQAAQGNLTLAEDQAKRAVDLKYEPIKAQLETLKTTLDYNYKNLSVAEQKKADALKFKTDLQLKVIEQNVNKEKTFETNITTALSNGAPLSKVSQARALSSQGKNDEALALLSPYIGTKSNDINNPDGVTKFFSQDQINKGASTGNIPISDFKKLHPDTQNLFINGTVKDQLDSIDQVKKDGTWKNNAGEEFSDEEIGPAMEAQIHNGNTPDAVKDVLIRKVQALFPTVAPKQSWWQKLTAPGK